MEQILLDVDLSKYAIYQYAPNDEYCAVTMADAERQRNISLRDNTYIPPSIKLEPVEETVEIFPLILSSSEAMKKTFVLNENVKKKINIRALISVVVQTPLKA